MRIKAKMQKAVKKEGYLRKLLETCKSWGGLSLTSDS